MISIIHTELVSHVKDNHSNNPLHIGNKNANAHTSTQDAHTNDNIIANN